MNLPNKITLSRIFMIPVFVLLFYLSVLPGNFVYAAAVFVLAAFTDFLDGYIARKYHLVTNMGKFLDPIADKVLVSTALILLLTRPAVFCIGPFAAAGSVLAGIFVAVILARELIVSGFRLIACERGIVLAADKLGKVKTILQDVAIAVLLAASSFVGTAVGDGFAYAGLAVFTLSVLATVASGINYIVKNRIVLSESQSGAENVSPAEETESAEETVTEIPMSESSAYDPENGEVPEVYLRALAVVIKRKAASIALVQRTCGVGYNHAGKILDWMEANGYVSPFDGKNARTVLITKEEYEDRFGPIDR